MPVTFIKGDIFEAVEAGAGTSALGFGADCTGNMDSGIAVAFRQRWPALAQAYRERCEGGKMQPGDVFDWRDGPRIIYVLGLARGGSKPKVSTFERAAGSMVELGIADGVSRLLLPRITGGKNGLDWVRVKRVLTEIGATAPMDIVVFEQFVRKRSSLSSG